RIGRNFAHAYIRAYRQVGFRPGFAFPVARPFVCECRTIPAIPLRWTIPGLPESLTHLPHRVVRTHLGATEWNPNVFAPIVRARPCSVFGRPVHLSGSLPLITTRWFSSSLSDPASRQAPCPPEVRRWWLRSAYPFPGFRRCASLASPYLP